MDQPLMEKDGFRDTNDVSLGSLIKREVGTSRNSTGTTTDQGAIPLDGWKMLSDGKWSEAAKSFGITENVFLVSSFVFGIFIGVLFMSYSHRHEKDWVYFLGQKYRLIGMARTKQEGKVINMPLYEEIK